MQGKSVFAQRPDAEQQKRVSTGCIGLVACRINFVQGKLFFLEKALLIVSKINKSSAKRRRTRDDAELSHQLIETKREAVIVRDDQSTR